ncbi:alpha/beta hydrolase-fold protein [Weissella hellenica]|uniref:alpha/beta hydrolase-fold protein n=1 Tax=Weissella hellenica TaxID=46256 RepID=UPI00388476A4
MAINRLEFYSEKLQMNTRVNVILPDHPKDKGKILLLLHGLHDDENSWINQTRLVSYASKTQITIIMPRADRSYYTNRDGDSQYFDYIGEEDCNVASGGLIYHVIHQIFLLLVCRWVDLVL